MELAVETIRVTTHASVSIALLYDNTPDTVELTSPISLHLVISSTLYTFSITPVARCTTEMTSQASALSEVGRKRTR